MCFHNSLAYSGQSDDQTHQMCLVIRLADAESEKKAGWANTDEFKGSQEEHKGSMAHKDRKMVGMNI